MSDSDSFINEVSEEVRRDRMFSLWRKYGAFVIGGIVAIVVGAGAKTWMDHQAEIAAQRAGGALLAAAEGSPEAAADALTALAAETEHEGAAILARLRAAAALIDAGDEGAAIAIYDEITASTTVDPLFQEFAGLRSVLIRSADMPAADAVSALAPFATGTGPFRLLALEAQGLAHLKGGDRDAAGLAFRTIMQDQRAPNGLRQRVEAVMTAVGIAPDDSPVPDTNADTGANG
ncbi:MAG: tetratricopeptide repeat protein [Pseudomonadota bacterium]